METDTKCVLGVQGYGLQKLLMLAIDMHNTGFFFFLSSHTGDLDFCF